ncbi:hypothetical protein KCU73_g17873, partial [Aureobasidium melanogenum]
MAPTASINAVLANQHYHAQQQQRQETPDSPVSPSQPTTPQFSWPRRVRSPEPHLPLRKASPERLRQRMPSLPNTKTRQKPANLFITTDAGKEALKPATAGSVAPPHSSRVNVKSNNWWENTDDEQSPARQRNFSNVEPRSRPRELSIADATLKRQGSWPLEDNSPVSMPVPEMDRNETRTSYRSQMTSTS